MYLAFGSEILTHSWVLGGWAVGKSAKIWIVSATISPMASFNAPLSYLNKFINKILLHLICQYNILIEEYVCVCSISVNPFVHDNINGGK